ncbi:MAG TPA: ATP synthase F0 subunit C [Candidatus Dojkabacteria bacterium]|jgi:F0F1-type ATP synthase membrane subunit c/vacuolar-type H+-ATPase subunit K
MTPEVATILAKGITIFAMVGTAIGEGLVAAAFMNAVGRNPKVEDTLFSKMIVAIALCESTAIYAFVAFFILG